jgi:hypothetical protein
MFTDVSEQWSAFIFRREVVFYSEKSMKNMPQIYGVASKKTVAIRLKLASKTKGNL